MMEKIYGWQFVWSFLAEYPLGLYVMTTLANDIYIVGSVNIDPAIILHI